MALMRANEKFIRRFTAVERIAAERGIDIKTAGLDVLESIYQQVKREE